MQSPLSIFERQMRFERTRGGVFAPTRRPLALPFDRPIRGARWRVRPVVWNAAPVRVQSTTSAGTGTTLTPSFTSSAGSIIVLSIGKTDATAGTTAAITDSIGTLTWAAVLSITEQTGRWSQHWWAYFAAGGAITVTVTFSASASARVRMHEVSGADTAAPIAFSDKNQVSVAGTSHACAASGITPTSNHLGFACWAFNNTTGAWTDPSDNGGWTHDDGTTAQNQSAYLTAGASSSTTIIGTSTNSRTSSNCVCFIKPPAAAGRLHRSSPLDGLGGVGQKRFNPGLSGI